MGNLRLIKIKSHGDTLIGIHHVGNGSKDKAVMIVHGYLSANRIGPYRMYFQIAEMLNYYGYDVFRIDFAGCGESSENQEITLDTFYNNFKDSVKYIKNKTKKKIILIGHCLGANLGIYYNSLHDSNIDLCFGISPTPMTNNNRNRVFSPEQIKLAAKHQSFERKGLDVHPSFLAGFSTGEKMKEALKIKSQNVKLYIPEKDAYVDVNEFESLIKDSNVFYKIIKYGDHHLLNKKCRNEVFEDIKHTILRQDFNYKHVIFDVDGTLANTEDTFIKSIQYAYKKNFNKHISLKKIKKMFGHSPYEVARDLNITEKEEDFIKDINMAFAKIGYQVFDGLIDILKKLNAKDIKVGLISSRNRYLLNHFINQYHLKKIIYHSLSIDDVEIGKPNPECINKYLNETKAIRNEVIYIGDNYKDYLCSMSASVDFGYALWAAKKDKKIKDNYCKFIFNKIKELDEVL